MPEGSDVEFSVIIATRDRASMLDEAISAALAQSHPPAELIVVDDGSSDGTPGVLARWQGRGVIAMRTPGLGVCAARNVGLRAARYEWIVFLDDDDLPLGSWLEAYASKIGPGVGLVSAPVIVRSPDGTEVTRAPSRPPYAQQPALLLTGAFAVRRDIVLAAGGYLEGLTFAEHTELGMRLMPRLEAAWSTAVHDEPVHVVRRQVTRRSARSRHDALLRVIAEHRRSFDDDPKRLARWLSIAGVDAFKAGEHATARRLLGSAFKRRPRPRSLVRLIGAAIPPLGRRIWLGHGAIGTSPFGVDDGTVRP